MDIDFPSLSPAQQAAADALLEGISAGDVAALRGDSGSGKTTVIEAVHRRAGGALVGMREFMTTLEGGSPGVEEAFLGLMRSTLSRHDLVLMDDLNLLSDIGESCSYPREHLLTAALTALLSETRSSDKKLVFVIGEEAPWPVRRRAYVAKIASFQPADYESICGAYLDPRLSDRLDYERFITSRRC